MEYLLEKISLCHSNQKNCSDQNQINIQRMVICYSHTIDLGTIKSNMISTEAKTLLKSLL